MLDSVQLGRTGLQVSEIALGTWRFGRETEDGSYYTDQDTAIDLLDAYAQAGGRFIDTADLYGYGTSEKWIGEWLTERNRDEYVIASKIYYPTRDGAPNSSGLNRKHLRRQIDRILERLGTEYVDILYTHRFDDTPIEEFMRTLDGLVEEGKVHYLGTSTREANDGWKIAKANEIARREGYEPFTVSQPWYNLVNRHPEKKYFPACRDYGIGVVPFSPLAEGMLTGKYRRDDFPGDSRGANEDTFAERYVDDETFDIVDVVREVADEVGASPAQVSLAWLLDNDDVVSPIVGASSVEQLNENLEAANVSLTDAQYDRLADTMDN